MSWAMSSTEAPHSKLQLALAVKDACARLDVVPTPESIASAASAAIEKLGTEASDHQEQCAMPEQGEYCFPVVAGIHPPYDHRLHVAEQAAASTCVTFCSIW